MGIKKLLAAGVAAAAMSTVANAGVINVGGVVWDPDSFFDFTSNSNLIEDQLDVANGVVELQGFGQITSFNGTGPATFCPGCELTYTFGGFTFDSAIGGVDIFGNAVTYVGFTGGWVNFWVDSTTAYDPNNMATAGDGALFLDVAAHDQFSTIFGKNLSLVAALSSFGAGSDTGSGNALLDVVGGMAAGNFDTNTRADGADFVFTSSFQLIENGATPDGFELFGSADLKGASIPEPSSVALLGLGLLGLGLGAKRKKA
ncbi:MAG: PEP-CTERM sorting domain-containing protein [Hahellaceae bacterium]|nr:PEP-CTERM sorting domain-containing protein [Hahellaceae bacterium]